MTQRKRQRRDGLSCSAGFA